MKQFEVLFMQVKRNSHPFSFFGGMASALAKKIFKKPLGTVHPWQDSTEWAAAQQDKEMILADIIRNLH